MKTLTSEFREWIDGIYGVYLDAHDAFPLLQKEKLKLKADAQERFEEFSQEYPGVKFGGVSFAYTRLVKGGKAERETHIHQVEIDTVIQRNALAGINSVFVGRMFVVSMFGFWNDHTRIRIEELMGLPKNSIKVPIMGDIRHMRDVIVHNRSRMDERCNRMEILKWYSVGDVINPSREQIEEIVDRVLIFVADFDSNPGSYTKKQ